MKRRKRDVKKLKYNLKLIILFIILFLLVILLLILTVRYKVSREEIRSELPSLGIFGEIDLNIFRYSNYTPTGEETIGNKYIESGFNINKENINYLGYNFNKTNYSIYDESLVMMMNFDEVSSLGENKLNVKDVSLVDNNGFISSFYRENNYEPVLNPGEADKFDKNGVLSPSVIFKDGIYHMWYRGENETSISIGYAISDDEVNWVKQNNEEPVFIAGEAGKFDSYSVYNPSVIFKDRIYHMWYSGIMLGSSRKIGYATSLNGINWTKMNNGDPVLDIGGVGKFDSRYIDSPNVIYKDNMFHMWYQGNDAKSSVGYATSSNGINWTRMNNGDPVLIAGEVEKFDRFGVDYPNVIFYNNKYYMFYTGNNMSIYNIGIASSLDGINWIKENNGDAIITKSKIPGKFDSSGVSSSSIFLNGENLNVYYSGHYGSIFKIGLIKSKNIFSYGKYGKALSFDGINDYVSISNKPEYDFGNEFSVSGWILSQEPVNYDNVIISSDYNYNLNKGWMFSVTDYGTRPYLFFSFGKNNFTARSQTNILDYGKWMHVLVVNSVNEPIRLFINGKETTYTNQDILGNFDSSSEAGFEIGKRQDTSERKFKGNIDELKIWNRALSSDEVMIDYLSRLNKYDSSNWNFYINQTKLDGRELDYGTYSLNGFLEDSIGTKYETGKRLITLGEDFPVNPSIDTGTGGNGNNGGTPWDGQIITSDKFFTKTYYISESDLIKKYTKDLKEKQSVIFTRNRKNYTLGIIEINNSKVNINSSFFIRNIFLNKGDILKYDLNDDKVYDLSIKLNLVDGDSSEFELFGIYEEIEKSDYKPPVDDSKKKSLIVFPYVNEKTNIWIFYTIVGIIILGILIVLFLIIHELRKKI